MDNIWLIESVLCSHFPSIHLYAVMENNVFISNTHAKVRFFLFPVDTGKRISL